jgi:hypothetical protein
MSWSAFHRSCHHLEKPEKVKPAFISRLCVSGLDPLRYHEQVEPQLLQVDGVQEDGLGASLISRTSTSKVSV